MTLLNIYFVAGVPVMLSVYINLFLGWKGSSMEPFYGHSPKFIPVKAKRLVICDKYEA